MSYQLTADQWRIVLLMSKNASRYRLTPKQIVEALGLDPEDALWDLYRLTNLKILEQDSTYLLFPGEAWPDDDALSLMFVWLGTTESPDKPEDVQIASALLSMNSHRLTRVGQGYFLAPAQEAIKGALVAEDPIAYLEELVSAPRASAIDLVRHIARKEVLRYWRIRPIDDTDDTFDFREAVWLLKSELGFKPDEDEFDPEWAIVDEQVPDEALEASEPVFAEPAPLEDPLGGDQMPDEVLATLEPEFSEGGGQR